MHQRKSAMKQPVAVHFMLLFLPLLTTLSSSIGCGPPGEQPAEWENVNGPYAREISALLPLRNPQGCIMAGMTNGEIAYSNTSGQSWMRMHSPAPGNAILQLVQHPDTPAVVYACTDAGLFLSRDSARSWKQLPMGTRRPPQQVLCLTFDPWQARTLFAGTRGEGILRSSDNGMSWGPANGENDSLLSGADVFEIRVDPDRPDRIVAAIGTRGIAITENNARLWRPMIEGRTSVAAAITHLALQPGDGATMIYATDAGSVYRTSNRGAHWSPSREASPGDNIRSLELVAPRGRALVVGTERGVFTSQDFGESWQPAAPALASAGVTLVLGPGIPSTWYAFSGALGLCASSNEGRSWSRIDEHLGGATATLVGFHPPTNELYVAVGPYLLHAGSGSKEWRNVALGLTGGMVTSFSFDRFRPSSIYVTTVLGAVRSDNGGATWQPFPRALPAPPKVIVAHPWFTSRLLGSSLRGNYYSTDQGAVWHECRQFTQTPPARSFTFRPTDAGAVFAPAGENGILLSSDGGISWEVTRYGLEQDTVELVSLDTADRTRCYAWTATGHCYRSLNGGLEWNRFTPPWERSDATLLALDPFSPADLVALVNGRTFYVTADGGTTWMHILDCKLPARPTTVSWDHRSCKLVAGTEHGGVYRINLTAPLKAMNIDNEN
jgi:photosystem II stability/assembly factor-like uncharacterized protein